MPGAIYPKQFEKLLQALRKLSGVGWRNAEKLAFSLMDWPEDQIRTLAETIGELPRCLSFCPVCGCLYQDNCLYCDPKARSNDQMIIIASPREVFAVESAGIYRGLYHVLGGLISPMDERFAETLRLKELSERLKRSSDLKEVIIALDSTADGDMTSLYVKRELEGIAWTDDQLKPKISRIAFGLPIGSSVENADYATLARAVSSRQFF